MINQIISFSSFTSLEAYQREVKRKTIDTLKLRIKLVGLTMEDLEDPLAVKKYRIGRDDIDKPGEYLIQIARAMGVTLVETTWTPTQAIISTPHCIPDYTSANEYIRSMEQRPKKEGNV